MKNPIIKFFHPLERFPFFQSWKSSFVRNLSYTLLLALMVSTLTFLLFYGFNIQRLGHKAVTFSEGIVIVIGIISQAVFWVSEKIARRFQIISVLLAIPLFGTIEISKPSTLPRNVFAACRAACLKMRSNTCL